MEVSDEAMLTIEQLKSMNELEMEIYEYIMHHKEQVLHMKIRELADEVLPAAGRQALEPPALGRGGEFRPRGGGQGAGVFR